jgi:hypothetical protein
VGVNVKLIPAGLAAIAKSPEMQALIKAKAEEIADSVRGLNIKVGAFKGGSGEIELPVNVTERITDRAHATVTIAHPAGLAVQAKHGVLTKAASQAGLRVRGK